MSCFFPFDLSDTVVLDSLSSSFLSSTLEAVAAGSPYRYPLWLARALNSANYDVKWDYESDRAIAKIADFYIKIAVFIIN